MLYAKYYNVHVIVGVARYLGVLSTDSVFNLLARHLSMSSLGQSCARREQKEA
jgi:hypothetical protein